MDAIGFPTLDFNPSSTDMTNITLTMDANGLPTMGFNRSVSEMNNGAGPVNNSIIPMIDLNSHIAGTKASAGPMNANNFPRVLVNPAFTENNHGAAPTMDSNAEPFQPQGHYPIPQPAQIQRPAQVELRDQCQQPDQETIHQPTMDVNLLLETRPRDRFEGTRMHEPVRYVNEKQFHRIIKRRKAIHALKKHFRTTDDLCIRDRGYIHENRHEHAIKRPRGAGGRFLKVTWSFVCLASDSSGNGLC